MVCLPAVPLSTKASVFSPCTSLHQILSEERLQLSLASKVKSNSAPASPAIVCTCGNTGVTASSSLEQAVNRVTDTSDDDAVTPVFPQVQTIAGAAGAELDFTFDANESWSLSSDKIWCKLVQGEKTDAFVLNGTAGKQTIKVKITDDDASKDMSVAQLFLNMGGQKVAIAEVKRSAADHIAAGITMRLAMISPRQVSL